MHIVIWKWKKTWNTHVEDRNPSPKPSKQSFTVLKLSEANFGLGLKNRPIRAID
jgi:hypothetical protein